MYYYETKLVILIIFVWLPYAFFTLKVSSNTDCYVLPYFLGGLFFSQEALNESRKKAFESYLRLINAKNVGNKII